MQNSDLLGSSVVCVICAATALTAIPGDSRAGAMNVAERSTISPTLAVDQIHYRHYHHLNYSRYNSNYLNSDNNDAALARAARDFRARELRWMRKYYDSPYNFYGYPYYSNYGRGSPCYDYSWGYPCGSNRWTYPPYWAY